MGPPAWSRMSSTAVPTGTSTTEGRTTDPATVTSVVPGALVQPLSRNQSPPLRPISARCASVSTFCTSVGRPSTPFWNGRSGNTGVATPSPTQCARALSSLATYRAGGSTRAIGTGSSSRSRRARVSTSSAAEPRWTAMRASEAPTLCAANERPSRTRCGLAAMRATSLLLAGSPSIPLAMAMGCRPRLRRRRDAALSLTARSLA